MTTLISIAGALLAMMSMKSTNPVKVSMIVLLMSSTVFLTMNLSSGLTWMPTLMFMLFMGGIIMMFMILSSILPNEKSMKSKNLKSFILMTLILQTTQEWCFSQETLTKEMKSFLSTGLNFWIMMSLILIYFFISMSTISTESSPMRTYFC